MIERPSRGPARDPRPDEPPTVSVIVITYDHEDFIAEAIASVVEQVADFGIELIVTEDASTDGTADIARAAPTGSLQHYTVISSPENLCDNSVFTRALDVARGEFVAVLDGDDRWLDPHKLAKQVDHLRRHPGHAMCAHDAVAVEHPSGRQIEDYYRTPRRPLSLRDLVVSNPIPGCSPLIRRSALADLPVSYRDAVYGDWPLYLAAARHGDVGWVEGELGLYRLHDRGLYAGASSERKLRMDLELYEGMDPRVRDEFVDAWRAGRDRRLRRLVQLLHEEGRHAEARRVAIAAVRSSGARPRLWPTPATVLRAVLPGFTPRMGGIRAKVGGQSAVTGTVLVALEQCASAA